MQPHWCFREAGSASSHRGSFRSIPPSLRYCSISTSEDSASCIGTRTPTSGSTTSKAAHGRAKTEEFGPGNIGFIQQGFGHYVEQVGTEPIEFFALFNSPTFEEISISKWLAGKPASLGADNFLLSNEDVG